MLTLCNETDAVAVPSSSDPESLEGLAVPTVRELNLLVYGLAGPVMTTLPAGPSMIQCPQCGSPEFHSYARGSITCWKCDNCGYDTGA